MGPQPAGTLPSTGSRRLHDVSSLHLQLRPPPPHIATEGVGPPNTPCDLRSGKQYHRNCPVRAERKMNDETNPRTEELRSPGRDLLPAVATSPPRGAPPPTPFANALRCFLFIKLQKSLNQNLKVWPSLQGDPRTLDFNFRLYVHWTIGWFAGILTGVAPISGALSIPASVTPTFWQTLWKRRTGSGSIF